MTAAALGLAAPAARAVPTQARRAPEPLVAAGRAGVVEVPGFRVHHLGVTWSGPARGGEVRVRRRGAWLPWRPVTATDSPTEQGRRALVYVGDGDAYEFRPAAGAVRPGIHAINTIDGARRAKLAPISRWAGSSYLCRAAWGADESLRFAPDGAEVFPAEFFPVQTLTVHHTVTTNTDPDPAATVRAIYAFQALPPENFGDVGYHLLIDQHGAVYEGRWSGTDPLPVFGSGTGGTGMSNGAHVGGFNAGNVGVALLGDFTASGPTARAQRTLTNVLALLAAGTGLDPLGTTAYVNPISGDTATVPTISGHRDWNATECPGETFYPSLVQVRADVAAILGRYPRLAN